MRRNNTSTVLSVFGFAFGFGIAGFVIRLLLVPAGLVGRTSGMTIAEGGIWWYVLRSLIFGFFMAIAGAIIAAVHNEFAKRS